MITFADVFRAMRIRLFGKQLGIAARLGCTDAAISYWESGSRLPSPRLIGKLVECLSQAGARPEEISELLIAYRRSVLARNSIATVQYGSGGAVGAFGE